MLDDIMEKEKYENVKKTAEDRTRWSERLGKHHVAHVSRTCYYITYYYKQKIVKYYYYYYYHQLIEKY